MSAAGIAAPDMFYAHVHMCIMYDIYICKYMHKCRSYMYPYI